MRTLLMSGSVYSVAERFATAMLVESGVVAWIGSDAGAQVHRDDVDRIVDLGGDLVAPAFVDLGTRTPRVQDGFAHASTDAQVADGWTDEQYARADGPLGVVPVDPCRLRSRISAGLPTALVPGAGMNGWRTVRAAVYDVHPAERISARAAFAAITRSPWRVLGRPDAGVLAVGAEATFVRWHVSDLVVQTPDERISNWSTDPRAATPGLPPLAPGEPLPQFVGMWRAGSPL
jgi:cytosine/adenosine deaminase-related metal-dependent hydrolase